MGAGDMDYPPPPRPEATMPPRLVFDAAAGPSGRKPAGFAIGADRMFLVNRDNRFFVPQKVEELSRGIFDAAVAAGGGRRQDVGMRQWNVRGSNGTQSADGSGSAEGEEEEEEEDADVEDDADDGDGEIDGLVSTDNGSLKYRNNSSGSAQSSSEKMCPDKVNSQEDQSSFGSSRGGLEKDGNNNCKGGVSEQQQHQVRGVQYANAMTLAAPEMHYAHILQGGDVMPLVQKVAGREVGFGGHSGRRDIRPSVDFGESLRMHLSDPITGALMDDAMVLRCGHSFGSAGMEHVMRRKACSVCGQPVLEDSIRPNLGLRSAVQAFQREVGLHPSRAQKRRRERFEQERCNFDNSFPVDISRAKGVQFPFSVSDRVIIKGNKRTPQRFVGRVAVVTAQCLNGWYVVKTLDNAESVKLQYRSLEKAPDDLPLDVVLSRTAHSNWL